MWTPAARQAAALTRAKGASDVNGVVYSTPQSTAPNPGAHAQAINNLPPKGPNVMPFEMKNRW